MRITPKTITAVPFISVDVTAMMSTHAMRELTCANEPVCEDEVEN